MDHGDRDERLTDLGSALVVLAQPPVVVQPAKRPFHQPAGGEQLEPNQLRRPLDDAQRPVEGRPHRAQQPAGIATVGKGGVDARQPLRDGGQQLGRPLPILAMRGMHDHRQQQPHRLNEDVPLPSRDLLPRVVPAKPPPFSVVCTDWLSMMARDGSGSRPACTRSSWRSASLIASQVPSA